jgi:hypothetical protein
MSQRTFDLPRSQRAPRRKFSQAEDDRLRQLVSMYGEHNWPIISAELGSRAPRRCKERWTHYLAPSIPQRPWTPEEDQFLEDKVREFGRKWKVLEQCFPGRTDINLKNRYNLLARKKTKASRVARHLPIKRTRADEEAPRDRAEEVVKDIKQQIDGGAWTWNFEVDV